jgi:hypothetical protein
MCRYGPRILVSYDSIRSFCFGWGSRTRKRVEREPTISAHQTPGSIFPVTRNPSRSLKTPALHINTSTVPTSSSTRDHRALVSASDAAAPVTASTMIEGDSALIFASTCFRRVASRPVMTMAEAPAEAQDNAMVCLRVSAKQRRWWGQM